MHEDRIKYLKRAIKRTYKRYTGERTDGEATLLDVAKFFNIAIDETRIEDYTISTIDYNIPTIEIKDKKNDICYSATYTGTASLLSYNGPMQFNNVICTSPVMKKESLYYIGEESPIITRMTFVDGDHELYFEREAPNTVSIFNNPDDKMVVRYLQNVTYKGKNEKQHLLSKIYSNAYEGSKISGEFEQIYTYGLQHFISWYTTQDKYNYIRNNNLVYGINNLKRKGLCKRLMGICFESTDVPTDGYFPLNMYSQNYPLLKDEKTKSAMIFKIETEDNIDHSLQVYKNDNGITIMYHSKKDCFEGGYHEETVVNEEYSIPSLSEGTISSDEIKNILLSLQSKLGFTTAFDIISNELNSFDKKINIRKKVIQEELDPLSPKLLMNKTFDEICEVVSAKKDEYFKLITEQFEEAININKDLEKGQSKVLKSNSTKK